MHTRLNIIITPAKPRMPRPHPHVPTAETNLIVDHHPLMPRMLALRQHTLRMLNLNR